MKKYKLINKMIKSYILLMEKENKKSALTIEELKMYSSKVLDFLKREYKIETYVFGTEKQIPETAIIEFNLFYKLYHDDTYYMLILTTTI